MVEKKKRGRPRGHGPKIVSYGLTESQLEWLRGYAEGIAPGTPLACALRRAVDEYRWSLDRNAAVELLKVK